MPLLMAGGAGVQRQIVRSLAQRDPVTAQDYPSLDRAVYRMVQECRANAMRHGGRGTQVTLRVADDGRITVDVLALPPARARGTHETSAAALPDPPPVRAQGKGWDSSAWLNAQLPVVALSPRARPGTGSGVS